VSAKTVHCAKHGTLEAVFVCDHTLQSLRDRLPRGLHMWRDDNDNVCGWCDQCRARAEASSVGADRVPLKFDVETLCMKCFVPIRDLNRGGRWD
jgi:hypothetical protein